MSGSRGIFTHLLVASASAISRKLLEVSQSRWASSGNGLSCKYCSELVATVRLVLTLRRRFSYPSADLVTKIPSLDRGLDSSIRLITRKPRSFPNRADLAAFDMAVLGYPRSGNTFLLGWLQYVSDERLRVLDGRLTHSALDLVSLDQAGVLTLIPSRAPLETVASFMVRANSHEDLGFAGAALRSFAAWYQTAIKLLSRPLIYVVAFSTISQDLRPLAGILPPSLVEPDHLAAGNDAVKMWLEQKLLGEEGQGLPHKGVPAEQMASLPREGRSRFNASAKTTLGHPSLNSELAEADRAFADFMSRAQALAKCL